MGELSNCVVTSTVRSARASSGSVATGAIEVTPRLRAVVTPDKGLVVANEDRLPIMKAWTNA